MNEYSQLRASLVNSRRNDRDSGFRPLNE